MVTDPQSNSKTTIKDVNGCFRLAKDLPRLGLSEIAEVRPDERCRTIPTDR